VAPKRTPISGRPLICVADVDTRLACNAFCAVCPYYLRDRLVV